jgi:hypothetical protein
LQVLVLSRLEGKGRIVNRCKMRTLTVIAVLVLAETPALAQMPGMSGGLQRPTPSRRKLRRNSSPVLSPALNMLPGASTSFEGQFLLRQLPQEKLNRSVDQTTRTFDSIQNRINQQESKISSGLGKTGHASKFMNHGGYYSMGGGARGR